MSDVPQFKSIGDMLAFAGDATANGTGRPLTEFVMHVVAEPAFQGSPDTINVLQVFPRGFEYMAQRFALQDGAANQLLNADQIAAWKSFKANERAAALASAEASQKAAAAGVVTARVPGGGQ